MRILMILAKKLSLDHLYVSSFLKQFKYAPVLSINFSLVV